MIHHILYLFTLLFISFSLGAFEEPKELFRDYQGLENETWSTLGKTPQDAIKGLFGKLTQSSTGKKLFLKAEAYALDRGVPLEGLIELGEESTTKTRFIRRTIFEGEFKTQSESVTTVILNKNLNTEEATLHLAHELTHLLFRSPLNLYDSKKNLKEFIVSMIEEKGGEVDATLIECTVMKESMKERFLQDEGCLSIFENNKINREKIKELFYRLGDSFSPFQTLLQKHGLSQQDFPESSNKSPLFISAAYASPYPYAYAQIYQSLLAQICENESKRLQKLKTNNAPEYQSELQNYFKKCSSL